MFRLYRRIVSALSPLRSVMLLAVRLYRGFRFAQTGWGNYTTWGKLRGCSLTSMFTPGFTAAFVSTLEFFGGVLLMLGLFSRPFALLVACSMFVACWTADREALSVTFSGPGKFCAADAYTFLLASLMVLIFGAGFLAVDTFVAKRLKVVEG